MIEVERWKSIAPNTVAAFKDKDTGIINEFAFMRAKKKDYPLHYFVFKQTASHLPHEANVEQIFSLGGGLMAQTRPPPKYKGTHLDPPLPPHEQAASPTRI